MSSTWGEHGCLAPRLSRGRNHYVVGNLFVGHPSFPDVLKRELPIQKESQAVRAAEIGCQAKNGGEISRGGRTRLVARIAAIKRPDRTHQESMKSVAFSYRFSIVR